MRITILTLFPEIINEYLKHSIIKKAIEANRVEIEAINFREFSSDSHSKVDGKPYGGGPGMVLSIQPIVDCLKKIKSFNSKVILLSPSGKQYNQNIAKTFLNCEHLIIICGHYEGFDERILNYIDYQISIGDFILTGGELGSLIIVDTITRLIPDVINKESLVSESFEDECLLDYPVYTKPFTYDGYSVPSVLSSGNHKLINEFREKQRIIKTRIYRPDLYKSFLKKKGKQYESN